MTNAGTDSHLKSIPFISTSLSQYGFPSRILDLWITIALLRKKFSQVVSFHGRKKKKIHGLLGFC